MKGYKEFLNEYLSFESKEHTDLIKFVKSIKTYMEIYDDNDDSEILLQTRENGDVGSETVGKEDVKEAERLSILIKKKFPNVKVEIEEVDEWVSLLIKPIDVAKLASEADKKKQKSNATKLISNKLKVSSKKADEIVEYLSYAKEYYEKNKDESRINNGFRVYSKHSNAYTKDFKNADDVLKYISKPKFIKDLYNSANPRNEFIVYLYGWGCLDLGYDEDARPYLPNGETDWRNRGAVLQAHAFYGGNIDGEKDLLKKGKKVITDFISAYKIYVLGQKD